MLTKLKEVDERNIRIQGKSATVQFETEELKKGNGKIMAEKRNYIL